MSTFKCFDFELEVKLLFGFQSRSIDMEVGSSCDWIGSNHGCHLTGAGASHVQKKKW